MFRYAIILIVASLFLSGCAGGVSGIMSSSVPGHWLIYKVDYPDSGERFDQSAEGVLDNLIFNEDIVEILLINHGYEKNWYWRSPLLVNSRVATFKQKYRDHYISNDIEISLERIIIMSTSYSRYTKNAFDNLESSLKEIFGETNVEKCFGTKSLYGHSCFQNYFL